MAASVGQPDSAIARSKLLPQHLQNGLDPGFPADRQSPEDRPPYQHCPRAISHCFEQSVPRRMPPST